MWSKEIKYIRKVVGKNFIIVTPELELMKKSKVMIKKELKLRKAIELRLTILLLEDILHNQRSFKSFERN